MGNQAPTATGKVEVTGLWVYPVKSCRGIALDEARLNKYGFEHDREWMVVTEQARDNLRSFVTLRQIPRMALVVPRFEDEHLCLDAPGMDTLRIPLAYSAEHDKADHEQVRLWSATVPVVDEGAEAAQWLSTFLKKPLRLVRMTKDFSRRVDPDWSVPGVESITSLTDCQPFLVVSQESLDDLVARVEQIASENGEEAVHITMDRFRPNIVVRGAGKPFAEDFWRKLKIGGVEFHVAQPCDRCMLPRVDPVLGELGKHEPTRSLTTFRTRNGKQYFGQYLLHTSYTGSIKTGQEVEVVEQADESNLDTL